jgi:hypothetical protein
MTYECIGFVHPLLLFLFIPFFFFYSCVYQMKNVHY